MLQVTRWVLLLGLVASAAAPVVSAEELIVDDAAPGVQFKGTWATSTSGNGFLGPAYRFRVAGDGSSTVRWPFSSPAGSYEVFVRWTSGDNRASNATYVVNSADGTRPVTVDMRSGGGA